MVDIDDDNRTTCDQVPLIKEFSPDGRLMPASNIIARRVRDD
jgi:hypothetical protein